MGVKMGADAVALRPHGPEQELAHPFQTEALGPRSALLPLGLETTAGSPVSGSPVCVCTHMCLCVLHVFRRVRALGLPWP